MNAGYLYLLTNFQNKPKWLATNQLNFTQNTNLVDRTWLWPDKVFMCTKVVGNIPCKKYKWSIVNNLTRSIIIKREVLPTEDVLIHVHFFKNSIIIFMRVVWHSCFMNQHFQAKQLQTKYVHWDTRQLRKTSWDNIKLTVTSLLLNR